MEKTQAEKPKLSPLVECAICGEPWYQGTHELRVCTERIKRRAAHDALYVDAVERGEIAP